jgi:hypothetical protein
MKFFIFLLFNTSLLFAMQPELEIKVREKISASVKQNQKFKDPSLANILVSESELKKDGLVAFMDILNIRYSVNLANLQVTTQLLAIE